MTDSTITVWTQPNCMPCRATKRKLDSLGIPYTEKDLRGHPDAATRFRQAGYTTSPIVETPIGTWQGFVPDWIKKLAS